MWWSRTLLVVALLALGPAGCSFHPLYGKAPAGAGAGAEASPDLASIRVLAIDDRLGQQLRNALVQRLTPAGEPARPRYELVVHLRRLLEGLGQRKDARSTLGRMTVTASYFLSEAADDDTGAAIASGRTRSVVSFNYLGARYASIAMERDAEESSVEELAENIRRQLAVHLSRSAGKPVK